MCAIGRNHGHEVKVRHRETVTFGGSGLNRDHGLRNDQDGLKRAWANGQILPMWRGQPLIREADGQTSLALLSPDHPILMADLDPVFLGQTDVGPVFAVDLTRTAGIEPHPGAGPFDATRQPHPMLPDSHGFIDLRAVMTGLTRQEAELAATGRALLEWHRSHAFCSACGKPSATSHGGWQRHCAGCHASHFPRTDPVVIMLITHGNSVLLGRSPGWPEGMYSLLAGFVEPGETLEAAVRREVAEETNVKVGEVRYLASQPWPFPANLMLGAHGVATSREIVLDPAEVEDALWLSREDVVQVLTGLHPKVWPARRGSIAQFILDGWLADRLD